MGNSLGELVLEGTLLANRLWTGEDGKKDRILTEEHTRSLRKCTLAGTWKEIRILRGMFPASASF